MYRRRHGRIRTPGLTCHLGNQLGSPLPVESLSMGGAFLVTTAPLRAGTAVMLDLVRPGLKKAIRLGGRVASVVTPQELRDRSHRPGMGIQFDRLDADTAARLQALLATFAPGPAVLEGDRRPEPVVEAPRKTPAPLSMELLRQPLPSQLGDALEPVSPPRAAPRPVPPNARNGGLEELRSEPAPEIARLMVQVRGLMLQLAEWQLKADGFEREKNALAAEVQRLRRALVRPPE